MMTQHFPPALAAEVREHPYPILFATVSGAHLYGFESADSDWDLRGVHLLPLPEVLSLTPGPATIERSDVRDGLEVDLVTHDAAKFFTMMLKRNGYVLEQLYSPLVIHGSSSFDELRDIGHDCVTRHHAGHYLGFARRKREEIAKAGETATAKQLLYLVRVLLTGIHLMRTGRIEANLPQLLNQMPVAGVPELIEQKRSGREKGPAEPRQIADVVAASDRLTVELESARDSSDLPSECNALPLLNDLLIRLRTDAAVSP